MPITYSDTRKFSQGEIGELFLSVGWASGKYPDRLKQAMSNSAAVFSAWDAGKLVGLINCLSDEVTTAYIHYLLVRPEYQGQGIGSTLLQMMLDRYSDCLRKVLIADDGQTGFYEKCGFVRGTGTTSMFCDTDRELTEEIL